MKKIIAFILALFVFVGNASAWDIYTYPTSKIEGAPDMREAVMYYFSAEAVEVIANAGTETPARVAFAKAVMMGNVNVNELSRKVATNPSVAAKSRRRMQVMFPIWHM